MQGNWHQHRMERCTILKYIYRTDRIRIVRRSRKYWKDQLEKMPQQALFMLFFRSHVWLKNVCHLSIRVVSAVSIQMYNQTSVQIPKLGTVQFFGPLVFFILPSIANLFSFLVLRTSMSTSTVHGHTSHSNLS